MQAVIAAHSYAGGTARLQRRGIPVVAVQNPLTSLAGDVAATSRAIEARTHPVVLVAHSWGGTVITQAGTSPKVAALIYIAAFAPDLGESTSDVQFGMLPAAYLPILQVDAFGYVSFPRSQLPHFFAQDVSPREAGLLAATQGPIFGGALADKVTQVAWRNKPSWYQISELDRMIYQQLQRQMAARMNAHTSSVRASHVAMLSEPRQTTRVILEAVEQVRAQGR